VLVSENGLNPRQIWNNSVGEGERRVNRRPFGIAATGLVGGFDVMIGLALVVTLTGAMMAITTEEVAHAVGALPFGVAFVLITIGRSELFTENFLVPVVAVLARRGTYGQLVRMWGMSLALNALGICVFAAILSVDGVLPASAHEAAGILGQTWVDRDFLDGFASAIAAGTALTLFTWLTMAARDHGTRLFLGMIIGYVLLLPQLNHAIVSFGEVMLGIFTGTTDASLGEVVSGELVAVAGNVIGGIGLVTVTRLIQVSGESRDEDTAADATPS
jgi:formate/nitrite transporter FocA (FNT family)